MNEQPSDGAIAVTRLTLTDFRNYQRCVVDLPAAPVVLTGPNGAGKTNLLEAVSLLSPGRGLRRVRLSDMTRHGAPVWAVSAETCHDQDMTTIGTGLVAEPGQTRERRVVRIDGANAGPGRLAGLLPMTWLTPQMDPLFSEGVSARRRFLDRLVLAVDPDHGTRFNAYERAMRERLRLLRDGQMDDAWLTALEAQMAEHGVAVAAARLDWRNRLATAIANGVGPFPAADIVLDGVLEQDLAGRPAVQVEEAFAADLRRYRSGDGEARRTRFGPHRTDLVVRHIQKDLPAAHCSTGEQKALLISIILGGARLQKSEQGLAPILLLDEVAAHLDATRRAALFDEICALQGQAFLTGTDHNLFEAFGDRAQYIAVEDAKLNFRAWDR